MSAPEPGQRQVRAGMLAVVATFVIPLVLAVGLYFAGWRPHATNYGHLVNPAQPVPVVRIVDIASGTSVSLSSLYGKWMLLYLAPDQCGAECTSALYKLRAMALFQGDNAHRVRRVLMFGTMPSSARLADLRERFPGLRIAVTTADGLAVLDQQFHAQAGTVEVLDPLGNWMMWYAPDADARGMRRDLTRLLAVSQIG